MTIKFSTAMLILMLLGAGLAVLVKSVKKTACAECADVQLVNCTIKPGYSHGGE